MTLTWGSVPVLIAPVTMNAPREKQKSFTVPLKSEKANALTQCKDAFAERVQCIPKADLDPSITAFTVQRKRLRKNKTLAFF